MIFIPIVSQTYCDPKCFAWEHEFKVFIEQASSDEFGMKTKLAGGNVASRVLPVKIHELDIEDTRLFESEVGGVLRSIDFIYNETGVNRPLMPDDSEQKNLNETKYRNQVNKVANAIKEIISGIKGEELVEGKSVHTSTINTQTVETKPRSKNKVLLASIAVVVILVLAYFIYINQKSSNMVSEEIDKSVAVLAFEDMSPNKDQEYLGDGIAAEIINALVQIEGLKVAGRTSSFSFKGKDVTNKEIGNSLNVKYILEGSVRKMNNNIRITVQLIDVEGFHIWSDIYDESLNDIFSIQKNISENIIEALNILLDEEERAAMFTIGTRNVEAYEEYLKGLAFFNHAHAYSVTDSSLLKANVHFEKAISLDPAFPSPYAKHHDFYAHYFIDGDKGIYKNVLKGVTDQEVYKIISDDLEEAIKLSNEPSLKLIFQLDKIFLSDNWTELSKYLNEIENADEANKVIIAEEGGWFIPIFTIINPEYLKTSFLNQLEKDPYNYIAKHNISIAFNKLHQLDSAAAFLDGNKGDIQNIPNLAQQRGIIELMKGNYQHAHSILESSFLKQNVEMDNFSEYYVLSKLLSGNDRGLPELTSYIDELGLRALPFYNIMGQYEKADSIASIYDAKFLGPCIITRYISKNPLYFHLSATPNFSARLKELGINPMQYESENYYQFPLVTLDN